MATTQDYENASFEITQAFYDALVEVRRGQEGSAAEIDAVTHAFAVADAYGVDPGNLKLDEDTIFGNLNFDRGFYAWSLKATQEEILTTGLAIALLSL